MRTPLSVCTHICISSLGLVTVALTAFAASAQVAIDRPVTIYIAGGAGGGIDLYGRVVGRHIGRHIPGKPLVKAQIMTGAGGIRAADFLARQAPKDGTAIGTFANGPTLEPLIGARKVDYRMDQFTFIGAVTKDVSLCIASPTTSFKSIEDVKKKTMLVSGTGAASETDIWPMILNDVLGTHFKLVSGYLSTTDTMLAIERGETDGRCGLSLSSLKSVKPEWLRDKTINILVQIARDRSSELPSVPWIFDLVSKADDRQMLEFLTGPSAIARPFVGPPGLPAATAETLRRAFDATMRDPEFLADAAKIQAVVEPTTGERAQELVSRLYATPRPITERIKKFFTP